ncbi:hypothetical protein ACWG8W_06385 [Citricoccus zhacaiensis]
MSATESNASGKRSPRIKKVAAITAAVGILTFTGIGVANAASVDVENPIDSRPITGKHTLPDATFGNTAPHHVYKLEGGACLNEFWLLSSHYQSVGDWMSDYGTWGAEPDYVVTYSESVCDDKNLDNPYFNVTNAWLTVDDFLA